MFSPKPRDSEAKASPQHDRFAPSFRRLRERVLRALSRTFMNITSAIFQQAKAEDRALKHGEQSLSYGELRGLVEHCAASMRSSAAWPGSVARPRVGLSCPNGFAHVVLSLGVLQAGGVLVPIPGELALPERQRLADETGLHLVLSTEGQNWNGHENCRVAVETEGLAFHLSEGVAAPQQLAFSEGELNALNPALIRFSSGTTGRSKGVVISHESLLARVRACNAGLGIGPCDRVIWMLPMAHHFAVSIVLYLLHGATTIIVDSHMGEDVFAELNRAEGTVLYAAPFHYASLAGYAAAHAVPSLRLAVSTASALPSPTAETFRAKFGITLTQGFGIIEAGLPILNIESAASKPTAIGRAQPGFELMIQHPDEQGVGELLIRGPGMFDAYLQPWQERAKLLADGWFPTGDLARRDTEGDFHLAGRLKSLINVAGLKCFPEEIEQVLIQHPSVSEARVYALPHPEMGSVPAAEIVPTDAANPPKPVALSSFCKERLAQYKIPLRYQFVASIERTASGKIKR